MKKLTATVWVILIFTLSLASCGTESAQAIVSKELGLDASGGSEVSSYDTHSGNGDGVTCIALSFDDDAVLEEIAASPDWKAFPLDATVEALVYGVGDETKQIGPFLTDESGAPLVPKIQNGYYLLNDRQAEQGKATGADILHRASFNFTLGLYDTDAGALYLCRLDT